MDQSEAITAFERGLSKRGAIALYEVARVLCKSPLVRPALGEVASLVIEELELNAVFLAVRPAEGGSAEVGACSTRGEGPRRVQDCFGLPALWIVDNQQVLRLETGPCGDERFTTASEVFVRGRPYVGVPVRAASGRIVGTVELQAGQETAVDMRELECLAEAVAGLVSQHHGSWWEETHKADDGRTSLDRSSVAGFEAIVGQTPAMRRVFSQIRQVAKWNTTVLIMGESGTGKELIANAIHHNSPRAKGPFIKLNCAALPDNLLESELFGHEKGAFTGALTRHTGRFEQAHRGTLFLDEIGEISPSFQAKLLRVLQEGEYERLGGTQTLHVDVRVIAATNKDLEQEVEESRFRQDLFYRLNVMPIFTPALRERKEDITQLASFLVRKIGLMQGRSLEITDGAVKLLVQHDWPGNVRELENTLERAAIMSETNVIDADAVVRSGLSGERAPGSASPPVADLRDPTIDERERVLAALERAGWVQAKAARLLGMTPRQVAYRIQILKIDVPRF